MKNPVLIATLATAMVLIPVAWWAGDILVLAFAALIPFLYDLKKGNLH